MNLIKSKTIITTLSLVSCFSIYVNAQDSIQKITNDSVVIDSILKQSFNPKDKVYSYHQ